MIIWSNDGLYTLYYYPIYHLSNLWWSQAWWLFSHPQKRKKKNQLRKTDSRSEWLQLRWLHQLGKFIQTDVSIALEKWPENELLPHWEGKTPNFRRQGVKNSSGEHHLEMRSAYIDILYRYTYNNIYIYTVCILYSNKKIYNPIWDRKWMDPRRRCVAGQSHEAGVGVGTMDSRPRHSQTKWRCLAGKYLKWWMWNIAMKGKRPM